MYLKYEWLTKRTPRSVDNLRLWAENPRLDPEETYLTVKDYASEMTSTSADRENFLRLCKSIARNGFIPGDPVVVWQNESNKKYYVAEGNRRVTVLKLLREPKKAPKNIKSSILRLSDPELTNAIEKIPVCVAPSFDGAEWYISQRNSASSLRTNWSREQQYRWVFFLYEKYDADIDIVAEKSGLTIPEVEKNLRILQLRSFIEEAKSLLTEEVYNKATSLSFPISTFERFLENQDVRNEWGIDFNKHEVILKKDKISFLVAYAELIRRMCLNKTDSEYIDSRKINSAETIKNEILPTFPTVSDQTGEDDDIEDDNDPKDEDDAPEDEDDTPTTPIINPLKRLKGSPYRSRLILDFYYLNTDNYRLDKLFKELTKVPIKRYPNAVAASMRVFLDLAVLNYIETENVKSELRREYGTELRNIILKQRLEYIKQNCRLAREYNNIIGRLLNPNNDYSLDVLNGYVHGNSNHYIIYHFLNRFWDSLFPLFQFFLDIEERDW